MTDHELRIKAFRERDELVATIEAARAESLRGIDTLIGDMRSELARHVENIEAKIAQLEASKPDIHASAEKVLARANADAIERLREASRLSEGVPEPEPLPVRRKKAPARAPEVIAKEKAEKEARRVAKAGGGK